MRLVPVAATAVLAASFLVVPVVSLPAAGPVTPSTWTLPLAPAAATVAEPTPTWPAETARLSTGPFPESVLGAPEAVLAVPAQATEPFDLVAVTWDGQDVGPAPDVQVRVLEDGVWTGWEALPVMDEGPDAGTEEYERARAGTSPLLTSQAEGVEVRLVAPEGAAPAGAQVELVDAGTTSPATTPLPLATAEAAVAAPGMLTRAAWGADESLKNGGPGYSSTIKAGILHHTASTNSYSSTDGAAQVRAIYAYHTNSLGWNDIGYNFLVDKFGTIYEGRAGGLNRAVVGAHSGGFNSDTVGVAAIGNYESASPPVAMLESVSRVMSWKLNAYGRDPMGSTSLTSAGGGTARWPAGTSVTVRTVSGHRDVGQTACPGANLYPALASIRNRASALIAQEVATHNPTGAVERAGSLAGGVQVSGQVKDPDTTSPVELHVYVDGAWGGAFTASTARSDGRFGFDLALPVAPGTHQVCVYAINQGEGTTNPSLGCPTVSRLGGNPFGNFEGLGAAPGGARLTGWVLDPDDAAAVSVHVYVDGRWTRAVTAERSRADIGAAYPLLGPGHGFDVTLGMSVGTHEVCVYAINIAAGTTNPLLGCRAVTVLSGNPIGNFEGTRPASGQVTVNGWTLDSDVAQAIPVHVYVDGGWGGQHLADVLRPDVQSLYPGYSDQRGFSVTLNGLRGTQTVCVYAINVGAGSSNPLLGCRSVTVS